MELWGAALSRSASIPACRAAASISHLCYGKSRGGEAGERKERKKERKQRRTKLVCLRLGKGLRGGCLPAAWVRPVSWGHLVRLFNRTLNRIPGHNSPMLCQEHPHTRQVRQPKVSLNPAARDSTASTQNVYLSPHSLCVQTCSRVYGGQYLPLGAAPCGGAGEWGAMLEVMASLPEHTLP